MAAIAIDVFDSIVIASVNGISTKTLRVFAFQAESLVVTSGDRAELKIADTDETKAVAAIAIENVTCRLVAEFSPGVISDAAIPMVPETKIICKSRVKACFRIFR